MPDRHSYARAAIRAETACTAAKIEAERLRAIGLTGTAAALAGIARVEAVTAARMRASAGGAARRPPA